MSVFGAKNADSKGRFGNNITRIQIYTYLCNYIHAYIIPYIYIYIYMHKYIHMYTCMVYTVSQSVVGGKRRRHLTQLYKYVGICCCWYYYFPIYICKYVCVQLFLLLPPLFQLHISVICKHFRHATNVSQSTLEKPQEALASSYFHPMLSAFHHTSSQRTKCIVAQNNMY